MPHTVSDCSRDSSTGRMNMALRDRECFGMLALGSEDVLRFYPEMGTLYLKRMGDLASAALLRFL